MHTWTPEFSSKADGTRRACALKRHEKSPLADMWAQNSKLVERTYDYVFASKLIMCKIENMPVVGFFESSPRKAVTFHVEKDRKTQVVRELNAPKALPGFSGGRKVGRSKTERGLEEGGVEDEKRRTEMEDVQAAKLAANAAESSRVHEEPLPQAKFG